MTATSALRDFVRTGRFLFALFGAFLIFATVPHTGAGILGEASKQAHSDGNSSNDDDDDRDEDDGDDHWIGAIFSACNSSRSNCSSSSSTSQSDTSVSYEDPASVTMFAPFPYSQDTPGLIVPPFHPHLQSYPFSGRLAFEYGHDLDTLDRFAGSALIEWSGGFGFDASGNIYREDLGAAGQDELSIGDVNLLLRLRETNHTLWRVGIGVNWLSDAIDAEAGVNGTLRADFFPVKPLIFTGEIDYGQIGETHTFHGRVSAGVNIQQVECFLGYDYRSIGDADLEGPMLGLQFWY